MRRVLMLCYYFPPLGGIGSLRSLKLATYLPAFGWEPWVVAPRNGTYLRDPTLAASEAHVVRTASIELSRTGKRIVGAAVTDFEPAQVGATLGRLRELVRRFLYYPDPQIGWLPFALAAGRELLRERRFDAVFSTSFPITGHVVAQRLAREAQLPWVAEFRDPWTDVMPTTHARRRKAVALEAAFLAEAAAIVVPSADWADLFRRKGGRRVEVVTNGVDPADIPAGSPTPAPVLAYVGTFYPEQQSLAVLWPAVATLRAQQEFCELRLRFIGLMNARLRVELEAHGLGAAVETTGFLHYAAGLAAMASSAVLLLAGPRDASPALRGQIPAKTFEYLATGRPIVYVGALDADVAQLLREHPGCFLVAPGDAPGAERALRAALSGGTYARDVTAFTRRSLAGRVAALLDTLC
jgi:glycosyltransferase involved in cell wall biosynthesis